MNSFNDQHRSLQQLTCRHNAASSSYTLSFCGSDKLMMRRPGEEQVDDDAVGDDLVSRMVPAVTVVLEGRSICHRISLHKHESYRSLAKALRKMFVQDNAEEEEGEEVGGGSDDDSVDLSNAIPGHLVAYEDMENDLLLAGDLNWKDFVRVAKRIRILPAKGNSRKNTRAV